jgi:hypothetical protein
MWKYSLIYNLTWAQIRRTSSSHYNTHMHTFVYIHDAHVHSRYMCILTYIYIPYATSRMLPLSRAYIQPYLFHNRFHINKYCKISITQIRVHANTCISSNVVTSLSEACRIKVGSSELLAHIYAATLYTGTV